MIYAGYVTEDKQRRQQALVYSFHDVKGARTVDGSIVW